MESNQLNSPKVFLRKGQDENTKFQASNEAKTLNPVFDDLNNPATILNHIEELKSKSEATPHAEILNQLIEQLEPLDFELLAFKEVGELREQLKNTAPGSEQAQDIRKQLDKIKVNTKHYRILSIKNV